MPFTGANSAYNLAAENMFFEIDIEGNYKCLLCADISCGSLSNIRRHLRNKHKEHIYGELDGADGNVNNGQFKAIQYIRRQPSIEIKLDVYLCNIRQSLKSNHFLFLA